MNQEQECAPRPAYLNERGPETDILKLLDKLEDLVDGENELWPIEFLHRAWGLNLDEFHILTNKIRASLPEEVRRASRVAGDSDRIVAAARDEAQMIIEQARVESERILEEAKTEQRKLTDDSEIVRLATSQAKEIVASAEGSARSIRKGADEYAREVLSAVENHLGRLLGTIQRGREKLDQRVDDAPVEQMLTVPRDIRVGGIRR